MFFVFPGYAVREHAQVLEAGAVGKTWQYVQLLTASAQQKARQILRKYIDERIHFFRDETSTGSRGWAHLSSEEQQQLWLPGVSESMNNPSPLMVAMLSSSSELMATQLQTSVVWKRQIPDAVWVVLMVLSMGVCFLVER